MIVPGSVFEIPAPLAEPPQRARQQDPPPRENRWVLVLSNKRDCAERLHETVTVVLLSAKTEYMGRHDVLIRRPDGGVERDSLAQTDIVLTLAKAELTDDWHRGVVMRDTLVRVRAKLSETLGFPPGLSPE
jgi:hypothetical protein